MGGGGGGADRVENVATSLLAVLELPTYHRYCLTGYHCDSQGTVPGTRVCHKQYSSTMVGILLVTAVPHHRGSILSLTCTYLPSFLL